ncbi:MAG: nucleotidyltransferase domain-containing protein [Polyangiaceae bacterium]|nr:nucleotidyltransferase domain-containing protein [Polyangiaceae bacterium]
MSFRELNADQQRELVNSRQRFEVWRQARQRLAQTKGSMVWAESKGTEYLRRSFYDETSGVRRQTSLGPRSDRTEQAKVDFERSRDSAKERFVGIDRALARQAAVNRALGLGRVPLLPARLIRAFDEARLLGQGIRLVGTIALHAYEAAAGVFLDAEVTATDDLDLLFDSRSALRLAGAPGEHSLMRILTRVDRSFQRSPAAFRAVNRDGYLVDWVKPLREPPWREKRKRLGAGAADLEAVMIEGLDWLESSPLLEAIAIDARGGPLRMLAPDPRVFAAHKLWLSRRGDRDPVQRRRDEAQARVVAILVRDHLQHLPYEAGALRMLPKAVFDQARPLFAANAQA